MASSEEEALGLRAWKRYEKLPSLCLCKTATQERKVTAIVSCERIYGRFSSTSFKHRDNLSHFHRMHLTTLSTSTFRHALSHFDKTLASALAWGWQFRAGRGGGSERRHGNELQTAGGGWVGKRYVRALVISWFRHSNFPSASSNETRVTPFWLENTSY